MTSKTKEDFLLELKVKGIKLSPDDDTDQLYEQYCEKPAWIINFLKLKDFVNSQKNATGKVKYPSLKSKDTAERKLARWASKQRTEYREYKLR